MKERLMAYLEAVQAGENQKKLCREIGDFFLECNTEFLVANRHESAELFYQYLCAIQRIYGNEAASIMGTQVESTFGAIRQINTNEATIDENDSNLMTVRFLTQLYSGEQEEYGETVDEELLSESILVLLEGLEDIYFIFHIERDGKLIFPIKRLITKVIKAPEFISIERISPYHVRILQLAVEIFRNTNDEEVIEELRKTCHLKFLDYLDGAQSIIDTKDMNNYQTNGVMIFYNSNSNRVLIRHEREEYFQHTNLEGWTELAKEYNWHTEVIGYYREYELGDSSLTDYREMIKEQPVEFLKLIYDKGCYNIFLDKMLIKKSDGSFQVLNPFCINDKKVVREKIGRNEAARSYNKNQIGEFLTAYRWKCVDGNKIDRLTFGLCQNLLNQDNIGVELLLQKEREGEWRQSQVICNWVLNSVNPKENIIYILNKWMEELEYCASRKGIEEHEIKQGDLYPLTLKVGWIYELLGLTEDNGIMYGTIQSSFEGETFFCVELSHSMAEEKYVNENLPRRIPIEDIVWSAETDKDLAVQDGMSHYLSYNFRTGAWYGGIEEEEYFKLLARMERIQFKGTLNYEISKRIHQTQFDEMYDLMKLHAGALLGEGQIFSDFESSMVYRLIHNLLWSGVSDENWEEYYCIFHNHQKLSFENIGLDKHFIMDELNTLYIPKDNAEQDAVLYRVFERYLDKESGTRHKAKYLYNRHIGKTDAGEYTICGNEVKRLVFLFDNFEYGDSTKDTLVLYLGYEEKLRGEWSEDKINRHKKSLHQYICSNDNTVVQVKDICKSNNISEIAVYAHYGTEAGKKNIKEFLVECGFKNADVDYREEISQMAVRVKDNWKNIWGNKSSQATRPWIGDTTFIVVREFNLTKKNVFPKEMISKPERAITLFVKKPE